MIFQISANESNIGDWMSAIGIRRLLDGMSMSQLYCDEYFLPETLERLKSVGSGDVLLIGGGGLFQDYFLPFWRGVTEAQASGVQVVIWGVGLCAPGPDMCCESRAMLRGIARRSRHCFVRDDMTRQFLGDPGIEPPQACPSMYAARLLAQPGANRRAVLYAVHEDLISPVDQERVRSVVKRVAESTGRSYGATANRTGQGDARALQASLNLYAMSDLVVSSRLHGCILGLALGCRVLALSSDPKVGAFMEMAGLQDWVCSPGDAASVEEALARIDHQPSAEEFVVAAVEANRRIAQRVRLTLEAAAQARGSAG